jgi:hypothetical protein
MRCLLAKFRRQPKWRTKETGSAIVKNIAASNDAMAARNGDATTQCLKDQLLTSHASAQLDETRVKEARGRLASS